jgi:MtN3 and saliva related transmembrane protein
VNWLKVIGVLAGIFTTLAVIPQIYKSWKTGEAKNVSLKMYLVLITGLGLWFIYGVGINDYPIMVFNGIAFLLNSSMVFLILKNGRRKM